VLTADSVLMPRLRMGWTYTSTSALCLHMHVLGVNFTFIKGDKFGMLCVGSPIISWVLKSLFLGHRELVSSPPTPKLRTQSILKSYV